MSGLPHPPPAVTGARLAADLRGLGVRPGAVLMVHARMSALGWVVGGSESVVRALLDVLGPAGTLAAYASWEDHVYRLEERPAEHRAAYLAAPPVWDVRTGAVDPDYGRIPERVRTWPGAERSDHPEASVVAVGAHARELTADHPREDAYGPGSPFGRLVAGDGQVLLLGAPLDTLTLLHHAEAVAPLAGRREVTFSVRETGPGGVVDRSYTDIDTANGAFPYEELELGGRDPFAVIAEDALAAGVGTRGTVGRATCHLFPARELTVFAVRWLEERFSAP